MFKAANKSCDWMYSSISWSPVTSGAPSHTISSAFKSLPKLPIIASAVANCVISPFLIGRKFEIKKGKQSVVNW
jgi:hypothetical protein